MYFAEKKLGRCHSAESPTTAIVRLDARMRRSVAISSDMSCGRRFALAQASARATLPETGAAGENPRLLPPAARHGFVDRRSRLSTGQQARQLSGYSTRL